MKKNEKKIQLVQEWMRIARENLLYAKTGIKLKYAPYQTACFLCQSSGEKYLKAYLILNGWELQYIHDLTELLQFCMKYDPCFEELIPQCIILNNYITAGRYPSDLPFEEITKTEAKQAIETAEKIERFVIGKMEM